jgi:hypothetical protein
MYKFFAIASNSPLKKDHQKYQKLVSAATPYEQNGFKKLMADNGGILYLGNEDYVEKISEGLPINQDWKPVCEYYLGKKTIKNLDNKL